MRSGKLKALHDLLIRQLLEDPLYDVRSDGTIWTRKGPTSGVTEFWRPAGRYDTSGYIQISYRKKRLLAHRIVFEKYRGLLESDMVVDHRNCVRDDNRPENLQLATARENRIYAKERKKDAEIKKAQEDFTS